MERINSLSAGIALAVTMAFLSAVCALAFVFWPDATLDFFGAFMHGLELSSVRMVAPITLGRSLYGVVGLGVVGFIAGVVFATVYNLVGSR